MVGFNLQQIPWRFDRREAMSERCCDRCVSEGNKRPFLTSSHCLLFLFSDKNSHHLNICKMYNSYWKSNNMEVKTWWWEQTSRQFFILLKEIKNRPTREKSGRLVKTVKERCLQYFHSHRGCWCAALHRFWCEWWCPVTALNTERSHKTFKASSKSNWILKFGNEIVNTWQRVFLTLSYKAWRTFPRTFSKLCLSFPCECSKN